jgi:hypothetical protein
MRKKVRNLPMRVDREVGGLAPIDKGYTFFIFLQGGSRGDDTVVVECCCSAR